MNNNAAEATDLLYEDMDTLAHQTLCPELPVKMTRSEVSNRILEASQQNDPASLRSLFVFTLINDYTPEQINQELDTLVTHNTNVLPALLEWDITLETKKKFRLIGKMLYMTVYIHFHSERYTSAVQTIANFRTCDDSPYEFGEAVNQLELNAWLGLLSQQLKDNVPLVKIMQQLEALRLRHIWSKEVALFAIPVTTAYFRSQASDRLLDGNYRAAYTCLEQALLLPEEDKGATWKAYAECVVRQINDPLFRSRATQHDLEKLKAKMDYLFDLDFWTPELDIGRFRLKNILGEV